MNTNIASLRTQRRLARNTTALQRSFERLSSGLRIVRASDDAAGLSIASSLSVDARVYTQGIRNLNDGVSYLNIADGAMDQLKAILFRCRELSTQAANGTLSNTQRQVLHEEAGALSNEYNRILSTAEFNGRRVFDAESSDVKVQCGYGENEAISARTGEGVITTETVRASTTSSGGEASGGASENPCLSADGRYVAFYSDATDLVAGDTNGEADIFVKDLLTGNTTRASTDSSGGEASGGGFFGSRMPSISADGRYVAFYSWSTNLVAGDTNGDGDVFVKDLLTGITTRVSTDSSGAEGDSGSSGPSISADGRYVAFESDATNLVAGDTNGQEDVFVKDLLTGITTRVSTDSSGAEGDGDCYGPSISADGRYVAFESNATNLVAGDTNGKRDAFVKDLLTGVITRVSTDSSGAQADDDSYADSSISADGRYVAFRSYATNLVAGDTNAFPDIFVKDLLTGITTRVSTDSSGAEGDGGSYAPAISADGRYVAFQSRSTNLVAGDTDGQDDIFVKDLLTGAINRANTNPSGEGGGLDGLFISEPSISADGRFVAFESYASDLVAGGAGDTNGNEDIFIAQNTAISAAAGFSSAVRPLVGIFLKDRTLARMAQGTLDDYLDELNASAGFIGSSMSRFAVAVSTLSVRTENFSAAASRIVDVDVAEESSELLRKNVLQQAASSILAQANIQPSIALKLLGNT